MATIASTATICLTADATAFNKALDRCLKKLRAFEARSKRAGIKVGSKAKPLGRKK